MGKRGGDQVSRWKTLGLAALVAFPSFVAVAAHLTPSSSAKPVVWDFTQGLPPDAKLRSCARLEPQGLVPTQVTNEAAGAGVQLGPVELPEAFRFEAEFIPRLDWPKGSEAAAHRENVLFDNLYVPYARAGYNAGLWVSLTARGGQWTPKACFGFGDDVTVVNGPAFVAEQGKVVRLSLSYDAGRGVAWTVNGSVQHMTIKRSGPLAQSSRRASIAERGCSNYRQFDGVVRRVSIEPTERAWHSVGIVGRGVFYRGEPSATLTLQLEDFRTSSNEWRTVTIDTCRQPGTYDLPVAFLGETQTVRYVIGPARRTELPVVLWGVESKEQVTNLGFTCAQISSLYSRTPRTGSSRREESHQWLDWALGEGIGLLGQHAYGAYSDDSLDQKYWRQDRAGKVRPVPEGINPELQALARAAATGNAVDLAAHPACLGLDANTEVVDHVFPSFNGEDDVYLAETGRAVPDEIRGKTFSFRLARARFPDGIVPDDDPILQYYRWWWRDGHGWPRINSVIAEAFREVKGKRHDFFSYFDPAVRCPPLWGSGGNVDVISQWVYANPEPMAVGGPVEELFAMSKGRPGQQVMIMTQLICYRSRIAPMGVSVLPEPDWVRRHPQAGFITVPPDSLVEATWTMLAKPVKGIMFHGHGTLYESGEETGYCFTNGETPVRLNALLRDVVTPLGPMLLKLPRQEPAVAVLESFTSVAMGGAHSWGWNVPAVTFLQRARLDPRVVYEEEVVRDGLENVRLLYLPQCAFLAARTLAAIRDFQRRGGLVIADEQCVPAIRPDIVVPVERFPTPPKSDHRQDVDAAAAGLANAQAHAATENAKAQMLKDVEELRNQLRGKYEWPVDSSSPDLVTYARQWGDVPYLFVINDRRTFGEYVGPWGLTMEKGLPLSGSVRVRDNGRTQAVYELSRGGKVPWTRETARFVSVPVEFATNDGRLFAFLDREIAAVRLQRREVPGGVRVKMSVVDRSGDPVPALLPVEIRLYDAVGRPIDGGWYAAEKGAIEVNLKYNTGDVPARCRIVARDRASGLQKELK